MLVDAKENKFYPLIKARLSGYMKSNGDFVKKLTLDQLVLMLKSQVKEYSRFLRLLEPNSYLECIYEVLNEKHITSYTELIEFYREYFLDENSTLAESTIRAGFKRKLIVLKYFDLIKVDIRDYGKGNPAEFYIACFAKPEKIKAYMVIPNKRQRIAQERRDISHNRFNKKKNTKEHNICNNPGCEIPTLNLTQVKCGIHGGL